MNILYFLTPKNQVANIYDDANLRQLMEKLDYHRYTAIPVINHEGQYIGTVAEGDVLRFVKDNHNMNMQTAQNVLKLQLKKLYPFLKLKHFAEDI